MDEAVDGPQDIPQGEDAIADATDDEQLDPEPTTAALIADTSGALLGAVSQIDRLSARQAAWKAEFLDQARRIALMTEDAVITVGKNFSPAQRQDLARRAFVAEVACELRIPERTAIGLIDESEALMHRLPLTLEALREGEISYRHAQLLIDQTAMLDEDATTRLEESALPFARTLTPARFGQKTRVLREQLRPESAIARREKSAADRKIEYLPARDGMAWLNLYTTASLAGAIFTSIRTQSVSLQGPTETRTLGELDADVCADAMLTALSGELSIEPGAGTSGAPSSTNDSPSRRHQPGADAGAAFRKVKPNVTITVPVLSLLGRSDEPATLDGYGPIDIETARRLVGQATSFTRVLTDPETGAALSWGTKRYKPTKRMRAFLQYRDQTCRFPGCSRRAVFCDIDHTRARAFNGPTELDNLACLCPKHHRLKHDTTWKVEQLGGGTLRWTSPNGRQFVSAPEHEVRPFGATARVPGGSSPQAEVRLAARPVPEARAARTTATAPPAAGPERAQPPPGTPSDTPPF